jgi:diphthamide synthase (EF-2-diphthine--ammonia ligase)
MSDMTTEFSQDELNRLYHLVKQKLDQDFAAIIGGGLSVQVQREIMERIEMLSVIKYKLDLLIDDV